MLMDVQSRPPDCACASVTAWAIISPPCTRSRPAAPTGPMWRSATHRPAPSGRRLASVASRAAAPAALAAPVVLVASSAAVLAGEAALIVGVLVRGWPAHAAGVALSLLMPT